METARRPGRDAALLQPSDRGWLLRGAAAFDYDGGSVAVAYQVEVDARWETKRGILSGFLGDKTIEHEIQHDDAGWRLNGARVEGLEHLVDLDYGFTPATNVLQLSRNRAEAQSIGGSSGRMVRSGQRVADRVGTEIRATQ